jgi:hypothetical protein
MNHVAFDDRDNDNDNDNENEDEDNYMASIEPDSIRFFTCQLNVWKRNLNISFLSLLINLLYLNATEFYFYSNIHFQTQYISLFS